jgi:acetyl-CoA C-acetyltransferase
LSHRYEDPAAALAAELKVSPRRTIQTDDGGNFPQTILNRACREILSGESTTWLIGGAETWRTRNAYRKAEQDPPWVDLSALPAEGSERPSGERMQNKEGLAHWGEWARDLYLPIEIYPLFENAWRAANGWSIDEHRDRISELYAGFSEVAAGNPHAWSRQAYTAAEIREPTPENRMVGFPYTKRMNANNAVEQAACFVVTSVEQATSLGISRDRWVFPWSGTDAHEHWFLSHRWSLAEAPAIRLAGRRALELAGVGADDLAHIDVYSCFPSAVQIAVHEIGLGTDRPLTVTGGLSFAGGPWNNYVSHAIAAMVDRLRDDAGSMGLVTANGGFLTKHAFGVYSTEPPPQPFAHEDLQDQVDPLPSRELATDDHGPVVIESTVVMHDRDSEPVKGIVSALFPNGSRAWANTTNPDTMKVFVTEETAGRAGHIDAEGIFTLT